MTVPAVSWGRAAVVRRCIFAILFLLPAACIEKPDNTDLEELIDSYRKENEWIAEQSGPGVDAGIRVLNVVTGEQGKVTVSVDLADARLTEVIDEILQNSSKDFVKNVFIPPSPVTARFSGKTIVDAINLLTGSHGIWARESRGIVLIERDFSRSATSPSADEGAAASDVEFADGMVTPTGGSTSYPLFNVAASDAAQVLNDVVQAEDYQASGGVIVTADPSRNSVLLTGSKAAVEKARFVLQSIDSEPGHIFLEALVVEFNTDAFRDVGSRLFSGASGQFSEIIFDIANPLGDAASVFFNAEANAVTQFGLVLNFLFQQDEARILTRPFVSTISGKAARLNITEDRFVTVETTEISAELQEVSSGVTVDVLPIMTEDDHVIMQFSVEESRFIPSLENVSLRRTRNAVSSTSHVRSGETVIIGGLQLNTRSDSQAGLPGLRDIPGLGVLFGHKEVSEQEAQVMMFITPRIWVPGVDAPLPRQDLFITKNRRARAFADDPSGPSAVQ